ncbi:YhcN/YlaJ family sporulation lipoprotein [Heyndrickxia sporothermodurans]|uniref:YhcN/YlaJ family sporulation lipoprotein n=1 Tax=Heyndrickxia sporothermodurans TaxID=46224 RepID=UPI002E2135D5|nr:YhcN/YlaJ family sporulation lipoprotein [Heyndrickxia sporothermodurans]MED3653553.1 YhcN/YlaJ family sporulation lipoprotein [Heyndrickxia sporothermodurans]MED3696467.1 YhcN/YlaJ family sporulation lipoprotein [Heyndrickxia sporothermodurans]MED3779523.1 YhcN/YlaJ family sporulation lipoprotein [Heyndrickxia sporothermodurans]
MKIAKTIICVGVVSGLLMGCGTNNDNNGTKRNNVSPVRYNNDDRNVNVNNKMRVADEAADRVAKLKEVDRANVIVTDNNAYVAVMLTDRSRNELSKTVENKIAKEVRKADKDIDNVYVSMFRLTRISTIE